MADPIGPASQLEGLAESALESSGTLYEVVGKLESADPDLHELLEEIGRLSKIVGAFGKHPNETTSVHLPELEMPLAQCEKVCSGFRKEVLRYSSDPRVSRKTHRKRWADLDYIGHDIRDFTQLLAGYRLTFIAAFACTRL